MGKGREMLLKVQTGRKTPAGCCPSCLEDGWGKMGGRWVSVWKMTDVFREFRWQKWPRKTGPAQSFVVYMLASQEKSSVN